MDGFRSDTIQLMLAKLFHTISKTYSKVFGQDFESFPAYIEFWPHEEDPEIQLPAAGVVNWWSAKSKGHPGEGDLHVWNWQTHCQGWVVSDNCQIW